MGGGELPKGFPVPNPTTSYWQVPPHRIANHRTTSSLPTSTIFDYVIVGSGITGAAVAHKLLSRDPTLSILMLEARTAASGASGRNGGHCRAGFWLNFKKYLDVFGEDDALKFEQLEEQTVVDIANFVKQHKVDCDFQDVETADTFTTVEAWKEVLEVVRMREEVRKKRSDARQTSFMKEVWEGQEACERLGLPGLVGAVTYSAHTQNPYKLVCKMLELSLEKGLNLQTETPVLAVKRSMAGCHGWYVQTYRGTVRAKQVVLATNAYTNALHKGFADVGFLMPGRSQVSAIRTKKSLAGHPALRKSVALEDRGSGDYFMIRAPGLQGEGDVLYGGGRSMADDRDMDITDDSLVNPKIASYVKEAALEVFGTKTWGDKTEEVRDWSGITCYTPDTYPLVGAVPGEEGLWASVGMNGHGMAMAFRSAEALVTMMTTGQEPAWFPKTFRIERAWAKERVNLRPEMFVD